MGTDAAFATLGVAVGSQPIDITRAFRALSRASHPDTGGDPVRFTAIVEAYRTLQRAGLVRTMPAEATEQPRPGEPARSTGDRRGGSMRSATPADRFYRRFLQGLDRAATMPDPVTRRADSRPSSPRRPRDAGPHRATFEEILDRELLRVG